MIIEYNWSNDTKLHDFLTLLIRSMIKTVGLNTTCRLAIELSTILVLTLLNSIILSKFDVLLTYYFCRHW